MVFGKPLASSDESKYGLERFELAGQYEPGMGLCSLSEPPSGRFNSFYALYSRGVLINISICVTMCVLRWGPLVLGALLFLVPGAVNGRLAQWWAYVNEPMSRAFIFFAVGTKFGPVSLWCRR